MRCIYCNSVLTNLDYCPSCGADVSLLKRCVRISNLLYNRGLEKASVRDMSGAISTLVQSLKFNKENIDARNLLGLCYYETGEVVSALCEWVISKNLGGTDNPADYYIDQLQNNRNQIDAINQSIRKYNQSIEYCHADHEDMAIMQLRKVVAKNPKFVKAQQLLALLFMKHQEYDKARRVLKKAALVDNTNTTTLRYLAEIDAVSGKGGILRQRRKSQNDLMSQDTQMSADGGVRRYISGNDTVIMPTTFRDSSTVATFINIGLGMLLGGAIVWFLAIPATKQAISESANAKVTDANLQQASIGAQLEDLQNEIDGYKSDVENANNERDNANAKADNYDVLLGIASQYVNGEQTAASDSLTKLDASTLEGNAKSLYDALMSGVSDSMFTQYYTAGTTAYVANDYATAADQLQKAVDADTEGKNTNYYNALYYLAFAYYNQGDRTNSDKYFNQIIEKYPSHAAEVQGYISSGTGEDTSSSQGAASMQQDGSGDITIYDDQTANTPSYDESQVAWTDPTTGLHYDMYGNLLG